MKPRFDLAAQVAAFGADSLLPPEKPRKPRALCAAPPSIHDQTKIDYLHRILGYYTDPDNPSHRPEATIIASMIEDYCERVRVARGHGVR